MEFESYRSFLDSVHTHPAATPATLAQESADSLPRAAVLHRDGKPRALIAGKLTETDQEFRLGYLKLGSTRVRVLRVVTGGLLGDVQGEEEAKLLCDGLVEYLREGEADAVQLVGVRAGSPLLRAITECSGWLLRDRSVRIEPHWWLSLPGSYDEFYKSRSRNTKSMIRQARNRIDNRYGAKAEVRCYRKAHEVEVAMRDCEYVATKTYQRAINVGFVPDQALRRQWLHEAEQGWLAAFVLYLEGEASAFWTGAVYRNIFNSYTTGFDPKLAYYNPGTFLLMQMVETFCASGVTAIDFGSGEAEYKRKFGTENREESSPLMFAPTFRGVRLALSTNTLAMVSNASRALLTDKHRLRLKTLWRRGLQKKSDAEVEAPVDGEPAPARSPAK